MGGMGWWLDWVIVAIFSNLNDSVILGLTLKSNGKHT